MVCFEENIYMLNVLLIWDNFGCYGYGCLPYADKNVTDFIVR